MKGFNYYLEILPQECSILSSFHLQAASWLINNQLAVYDDLTSLLLYATFYPSCQLDFQFLLSLGILIIINYNVIVIY